MFFFITLFKCEVFYKGDNDVVRQYVSGRNSKP